MNETKDESKVKEFIVCTRADEPATIDGSEIQKCKRCGHNVWVSPGTIQSIKEGFYKGYFVCLNCVAKQLDEDSNPDNEAIE